MVPVWRSSAPEANGLRLNEQIVHNVLTNCALSRLECVRLFHSRFLVEVDVSAAYEFQVGVLSEQSDLMAVIFTLASVRGCEPAQACCRLKGVGRFAPRIHAMNRLVEATQKNFRSTRRYPSAKLRLSGVCAAANLHPRYDNDSG